jgi:hypothetical protein
LDKISNYLNNNPWLNLLFLILALLSIFISIIIYFRSKREKVPVYNRRSFNLIENQVSKVKGLRVTHNGKEVKDLTLTKFALWNRGRATVNREDVAPSDPLRLVISPDHQILQADIVFIRTKANNFSINLDESKRSLSINFDYFHTNEGVIIDLYHTGTSSEQINLEGTVKGVEQIGLGIIEEDSLWHAFTDRTIGKYIPRGSRPTILSFTVVFLFILLTMPILIVAHN